MSVCPSARLSNAWIVTKWKKVLSRFVYVRKIVYPSFVKKNGWWGDPFFLNFGSTGHRWSEMADFEPMFARSASAVTPSERS